MVRPNQVRHSGIKSIWQQLTSQTQLYKLNHTCSPTRTTAASFHSTTHPLAAATSDSSGSKGPRRGPLDAHFIPFRLNRHDADLVYQNWAKKQYFAPDDLIRLEKVDHVDTAYLPFYVFDVGVATQFSNVSIGFHVQESYYDYGQKRWKTRTVTRWQSVPADRNYYSFAYSSDLPQLQVYGAFKYKWQPIQVIKTPMSQVTVLDTNQMKPSDFEGKEVDVFEMKIETAQGRVLDFIQQQEVARGQLLYMQRYGADEANVTADVQIQSFRLRRIYQPAYVYHLMHLGSPHEVMVNAVTSGVWGQWIYDRNKVTVAAAGVGSVGYVLGAAMHFFHASAISFTLGVIIPSLVVGVIGKYWSVLRQAVREAKRMTDQQADAARQPDGGKTGYQWQSQQDAGFNEQQRTEERYERTYRQSYGSSSQQQQQARAATPTKSYYDILGLKSNASLDDIRTAFRAKSFQYHPDVNKGNEKDANTKYREILEAYQTLRDPKKRAAYDASRR